MNSLLSVVVALVLFSMTSHALERLTLTGSSTIAPVASEIAKRFESLNKDVRVDVQTGGSSRGIADARTGVADIGMVSRALKDSEADLKAYRFASDGIGLIVHASNGVSSLTDQQIIDIYTGKHSHWNQVGGKAAPISVVNKAEGRSTLELFLKYFSLHPAKIKASVVIGDNEQGIKTVAGNPSAIGYVSIGSAEYSISKGVPIRLLPINGVAATTTNVQKGLFPLSRPLNFVVSKGPSPVAKRFIQFAQSEKVKDLIQGQYFVAAEK